MHVFGAFVLDIIPGTPDSLAPSGWPSCVIPGARMAACSSLRNVPPLRSWKGRSIPSKTNWTRSRNEPDEPDEPDEPPKAHIIPSALFWHGRAQSCHSL
jgi:hypothetical protein